MDIVVRLERAAPTREVIEACEQMASLVAPLAHQEQQTLRFELRGRSRAWPGAAAARSTWMTF